MRRLIRLVSVGASLALVLATASSLAFTAEAVSGSQPVPFTTTVKGLCADDARWRLEVTRDPAADSVSSNLLISSAKPGSRWNYSGELRMGGKRFRDRATLTADPLGRWSASMLWFTEEQGTLRVTARAVSLRGQECLVRVVQSPVPR